MKKTDIAYTAGIFDGEGYICLRRVKRKRMKQCYLLEVGVGNTNEWLIQWLKFMFGGTACLNRSATKHQRNYWQWSIAAKKALGFLKIVYPFLRLKKPQADIAIKFQEAKSHRISGRIGRGIHLTDGELAVEEAQRILMVNLHKGKA